MQRSRAIVIGIGTAALALVPSAGAGTQQTQYPTQFTKFKYEVSDGKAKFEGKIDSSKSNCIPDRKVKLYRKSNGNNKKVGGDETSGKGKFSIGLGSPPAKDGKYYAEVNEANVGNNGNTCLAKTSGSIKLS